MVYIMIHHTTIIMDLKVMEQIFNDTAYIRTSGSPAELRCAEYIKEQCAKLFDKEATIEEFEVDMADMKEAHLFVDGQEIICKGFKMSGSTEVEAPFASLLVYENHEEYCLFKDYEPSRKERPE